MPKRLGSYATPMTFILLLPFQFMFGLIYAWGSIAPVIHAQSLWPNAMLDMTFSITPLVLFPSVLLGGYLAGRHDPRRVLASALACFIGGSALGLYTASSTLFVIGYGCIALGLGAGLSTPACVALIGRAMPQSRGRWSGALLAVYGSCAAISAPLFHLLAEFWLWRQALGFLCAAYAALGIAALCKIPAAPGGPSYVTAAARVQARAWPWRTIVINALLLLATVPLGSMIFAALGRLALSAGFSASACVTAVTLMACANGAGRFAGGWLSDIASAPMTRVMIMACAATGYGALLVSQHWRAAPVFFWALPMLAGFSFGALAGQLPSLTVYTSADRATEIFSIYFGIFAVGSFVGPLLSAVWGFPTAAGIYGGFTVAGFVASLWLHASQRQTGHRMNGLEKKLI